MTKMLVGLDSILLYFHLQTNKNKKPQYNGIASHLDSAQNTMVLHFILQLLCYST